MDTGDLTLSAAKIADVCADPPPGVPHVCVDPFPGVPPLQHHTGQVTALHEERTPPRPHRWL